MIWLLRFRLKLKLMLDASVEYSLCRFNCGLDYHKHSFKARFLHTIKLYPLNHSSYSNRTFLLSSHKYELNQSVAEKDFDNSEEMPKKKKKRVSKYEVKLPHNQIMASLRTCASVGEQIKLFNEYVRIDDEELAERLKIQDQLESLLRPYFPQCRVILIGSSISGFGLKGCDVDLTFEANCEAYPLPMKGKPTVIPTVEEIDDGRTPITKVHELPPKLKLRFARRVLRFNSKLGFREPMVVVSGRCPILQFLYSENELVCDLSLGNSTAILTTKLLMFCGKLDERIVPLVKIINYWTKRVKLVGSIDKFKSYAFALMVFHFLQAQDPPILPPLQDILGKVEFFKQDILWDHNFENDILLFEPSRNADSIEELLKKFFYFYFYFDFGRTICPLTGQTSQKRIFVAAQETSENQKHDIVSTICIQDPVDVSRNVTSSVSFKICSQLIRELFSMCKLYLDEEKCVPDTSNDWGLAAVLSRYFVSTRGCLSIDVPLSSVSNSENVIRIASDRVMKALNHGLLFTCDIIDKKSDIVSEAQNTCDSDITNPVILRKDLLAMKEFMLKNRSQHQYRDCVLAFHCVAADTWQRRFHYGKFPTCDSMSALDKEHRLSLDILNTNPMKSKHFFEFICECFQHEKKHGEKCLHLLLTPLEAQNFPFKLQIFLEDYIPKFVQKLME